MVKAVRISLVIITLLFSSCRILYEEPRIINVEIENVEITDSAIIIKSNASFYNPNIYSFKTDSLVLKMQNDAIRLKTINSSDLFFLSKDTTRCNFITSIENNEQNQSRIINISELSDFTYDCSVRLFSSNQLQVEIENKEVIKDIFTNIDLLDFVEIKEVLIKPKSLLESELILDVTSSQVNLESILIESIELDIFNNSAEHDKIFTLKSDKVKSDFIIQNHVKITSRVFHKDLTYSFQTFQDFNLSNKYIEGRIKVSISNIDFLIEVKDEMSSLIK